MSNREAMKKAIEENKKKAAQPGPGIKRGPGPVPTRGGETFHPKKPVKAEVKAPPKQFKVGEKPPKRQRSAAARELRAKTRGRLPIGIEMGQKWHGTHWNGWLTIKGNGTTVGDFTIHHEAPGLFQLLEEIDVLYWQWAAASQEGVKT